MPGYQEILIVSAIVMGFIFLPRMMARPKSVPKLSPPRKRLSGSRRAVLALSVLYPLIVAAIMQPWQNSWLAYLYMGPGPVVVIWLVYWVALGFRHR